MMRTSRFAAKVAVAAASLTLLGAAPATADGNGGSDPRYHSTYNSKFECQYQAAIASSRGYEIECRAVRDGAYRTKWQLWIIDEWKYW